jgi:hypothetical protein
MVRKLDLRESATFFYYNPVRFKNSAAIYLVLLQGVADHTSRAPQARDCGTRPKTATSLLLLGHKFENATLVPNRRLTAQRSETV